MWLSLSPKLSPLKAQLQDVSNVFRQRTCHLPHELWYCPNFDQELGRKGCEITGKRIEPLIHNNHAISLVQEESFSRAIVTRIHLWILHRMKNIHLWYPSHRKLIGIGKSKDSESLVPRILQCSCLENLRDGVAWWAAVLWGCTESDTTEVT